ncbi:MAG: hypothetical protein HYU41_01830 [Candidatus Rokubacteria bacterium]|nr:hypothetical protein [Candidatus Rokubacteria bacterium]
MLRFIVLAMAVLTPASAADLVYDFEWEVAATVSRLDGGEVKTTDGRLTGTGRLVLRDEGERILSFEWHGDEATGSGLIGPYGPEHVTFPTPSDIGFPPAPPYRGGGRYTFEGERERPTGFTITWVEAFYCRTAPAACDDITAWERSFAGRARRVHSRTERPGEPVALLDVP